MPPIDTKLIFSVLGLVFLALGFASMWGAKGIKPQAKTWVLIGCIFSAVAVWLWLES
jgi:hypothetical protein